MKVGGPRAAKTFELLCDLGAKRLAAMDAAGVDVQVVSLAPGVEQLEAAQAIAAATETNEFLAAAIRQDPTRFTGLVTLPIGAPDKAAQEFERRVRREGFKGAIINGHDRGRYPVWHCRRGTQRLSQIVELSSPAPSIPCDIAKHGLDSELHYVPDGMRRALYLPPVDRP